MRPSFKNRSPKKRGRRRSQEGRSDPKRDAAIPRGTQETPGARCTRSPCAKCSKHTVVTTGSPERPRRFLRNGFTAYAALSSATNSSCHRHRRIWLVRPGWANVASADLTPATGARTTRFCRTRQPLPIRGSAMCCRPHFSKGVEAPFVHAPVDRSQAFAQSKACPANLRTRRRCRVHRIPSQRS
jgi:hypothetical protein